MSDRSSGAGLAELAASLEATSPGLAARVREASVTVGELPPEVARAFAGCLARLLRLEGPGREATQALLARTAPELASIGAAALEEWCAAAERIGERSVRAASTFAAAVLPALARAPGARGESLARAAAAVEDLGRRHGADPILQRFAARAGEALGERDGRVVEAWAELCEVTRFGGRRPADVLEPSEAPAHLRDAELERTIRVAARVAERDRVRAVTVFREGPARMGDVPPRSRAGALDLLLVAARSPEACVDALHVLGPVVRRIPVAARPLVLALGARVAAALPAAASAYVRRVLRVGETVGFTDGLAAFVAKGLALGDENPDAARAFFALESRTALAFLASRDTGVSFEEVEATLRGYLRLIAPSAPSPEGVEAAGLFPPIRSAAETLPVSRRANLFPTWEDNFALVKLQVTLASLWEEHGTLAFDLGRWLGEDEETSGGLDDLYRRFRSPDAAAGVFAHLEAARLAPVVARRYPGLAGDVARLRRRIFPGDRFAGPLGAPGLVLFLALGGDPAATLPPPDEACAELAAFAAAARSGRATVYDSATAAARLCERLEEGELVRVYGLEDLLEDDPYTAYLLEEADERAGPGAGDEPRAAPEEEGRAASGHRVDRSGEGAPVDPEMLRAYLEQHPDVAVLRSDEPLDPTGLFVAGLTGGGASETTPRRPATTTEQILALSRPARRTEEVFLHDEWDYRIGDYRPAWCRVHELPVEGEDASFFSGTLLRYAEMLPEVRRHFQRVKPEGYRVVHGLLDGEDFDLNAVVRARTDLRARREPTAKLYTMRQREERDVATLFLLDMSASTDEEAEPAPPADAAGAAEAGSRPARRGRRVIDIQKEALVIMAQALEEIGDLYAIYGFSGHGRDRVEFFGVKSFEEPLSVSVRARIGGIEPQRSTRMGAAIRQAITKLRAQPSRARHLLLLSDGFPQDFDYGEDRRSNVYGLRDTTMALREAQRSGIATFCITVDRAGNDYLREMCDEKNYLVIDDIRSLPRELPKIYSETTRGG